VTENDKHSSLLWNEIIFDLNKFHGADTRHSVTNATKFVPIFKQGAYPSSRVG